MKLRIYYGLGENLSLPEASALSTKRYECKNVLKDKRGNIILISRNRENDMYKVLCGTSETFFPTYEHALAYCEEHFALKLGKEI